MIDTLDLGQVVKFKPYRHPRDDYAGGGSPVDHPGRCGCGVSMWCAR
jgi:hypothetical protein